MPESGLEPIKWLAGALRHDSQLPRGSAADASRTRKSTASVTTRADVFDEVERLDNPARRPSTIGYVSPVEFSKKVGGN